MFLLFSINAVGPQKMYNTHVSLGDATCEFCPPPAALLPAGRGSGPKGPDRAVLPASGPGTPRSGCPPALGSPVSAPSTPTPGVQGPEGRGWQIRPAGALPRPAAPGPTRSPSVWQSPGVPALKGHRRPFCGFRVGVGPGAHPCSRVFSRPEPHGRCRPVCSHARGRALVLGRPEDTPPRAPEKPR